MGVQSENCLGSYGSAFEEPKGTISYSHKGLIIFKNVLQSVPPYSSHLTMNIAKTTVFRIFESSLPKSTLYSKIYFWVCSTFTSLNLWNAEIQVHSR